MYFIWSKLNRIQFTGSESDALVEWIWYSINDFIGFNRFIAHHTVDCGWTNTAQFIPSHGFNAFRRIPRRCNWIYILITASAAYTTTRIGRSNATCNFSTDFPSAAFNKVKWKMKWHKVRNGRWKLRWSNLFIFHFHNWNFAICSCGVCLSNYVLSGR